MTVKCPKCQTDNSESQKYCGECATPLPSSKDIQVSQTKTLETPVSELTRGTLFAGRYEIIEELGKGGMGKVYRVEDKKTREEIALKLIKPEISADKKTIERFRNELTTARKIAHRNVCRMFDLGEEKGQHYITMEYVPGEDLKSLIRRVKVDIGTSIKIAKKICAGLSEAHRLGVVHRDLKPANIMIDKQGNAQIMDFGIARSEKTKGITGAGVMIGTPEYMSPEQVEGMDVDERSDIYSLGIILYEMVAGGVPFKGETSLSIAMKHKTELPPDPKDRNPLTSEDLKHLILKCLEKTPQKRYQNTKELLLDLKKVGTPISEIQKEVKSQWKNSIAVLPFKNMSADPEQEYFCDGLSEELINALTQISDLRVVARTSAFYYKDKEIDIREIGQKLNVETVLEGSVRKAGNRIRVTAQLINIADGYHLWSERYDRELVDIFDIQDEISLVITDKLKIKLLGKEKEKLTKKNTKDVESYNIYLKALYFRRRLRGEDLNKSIELFNLAIDEDPDNALAWAGLAYAHMLSSFYGGIPIQDAQPLAVKAVTKALELDENLVEAYEARSAISAYLEWDYNSAEKYIKKAIELNPGYAWSYFHLANQLSDKGKFEASIQNFQKAIELDPLNLAFHRNFGCNYIYCSKIDRAIETFHRALDMDSEFSGGHFFLGLAYLRKSLYKKALKEMQLEKSYKNPYFDSVIGVVYSRLGNKDKSYQILNKFTEQAIHEDKQQKVNVSFYGLATLCFSLEEDDLGFKWLEKAYEARDPFMHTIKIDFLMDRIRSDLRFTSLLKKKNLE
jgi:serine/threonine protein kinase